MMKRNVKKLMMFVVLGCMLLSMLSLIGVEKAYACSCIMPGTYQEEMDKNTHVLDATVVDLKEHDQYTLDVELEVSGVWKGEAERETHILTPNNSAACGYSFNIGARYAVFAQEHDGVLHVSLCSATEPIADTSSIFDELGEPEKLPDDEQLVDPLQGKDNQAEATPEAATDPATTSGDHEVPDALSPDQIKNVVTEEELVEKIDTQHTRLLMVFVAVGVLFIIGAVFLFISRRKR